LCFYFKIRKLNWLDILIALIILIPVFYGFRRGFIRKILGIAGIIVGFILAVRFYGPVSGFLNMLFSTNLLVVQVISFLLIIALIYGITIWLAGFLAGMNAGTSMLDKFAGTIFGFIQGVIIASVLLFNLSYINMPDPKVRESSLLYKRVINVAPMIFDKVISFSPDLKKIYEEYKQKFIPAK
jgi:membrane protein required for colicin V production